MGKTVTDIKGNSWWEPGKGRTEWAYGEKAKLAEKAGISKQYLNDFLSKRRDANYETACKIEDAAKEMGLDLNAVELVFATHSMNPLFK